MFSVLRFSFPKYSIAQIGLKFVFIREIRGNSFFDLRLSAEICGDVFAER